MSIDIFSIEPTTVSKDLRSKIVTFYGDKKSGKTSTAVKFPNHLLIAFEKGYNALNNVMAQPVNKWSEFKRVLKQLEKPEAKERFETIIIDTVDIAWDACEKFICQREGVDAINEIDWGQGHNMLKKEFDEALRSIPLMDYGLVMISHAQDKQFTDENGESYQKIVTTLPKNADNIVSRMSDIIGYSRIVTNEEGENETRLYMRGTSRFEAGSRWKHTPEYIVFTYENLVNAIAEAIEKQEKEDGVTAKEQQTNVYKEQSTMSFEEVREKIDETNRKLIEDEKNIPKIQKIVEKHLGKGRKIVDTTEEQLEMLVLILDDLTDLLNEQ